MAKRKLKKTFGPGKKRKKEEGTAGVVGGTRNSEKRESQDLPGGGSG